MPGGRSATLTLGEWVAEYLETHQGERVTVAKLRWLLGKATAELGDVHVADLSPEQVCAWRLTVPKGHRFEATQALRQVLNRAVAWKLIDENPAKHGAPAVEPVQRAIGIEPLRDLYDLRHTYATFALRAGVPVFAHSRFMGTSLAMIDLHYGHLAVDTYQRAVSLLDALALERAVDAGWTPAREPEKPHDAAVSGRRDSVSRRALDARWTSKPRSVATLRAKGVDQQELRRAL